MYWGWQGVQALGGQKGYRWHKGAPRGCWGIRCIWGVRGVWGLAGSKVLKRPEGNRWHNGLLGV